MISSQKILGLFPYKIKHSPKKYYVPFFLDYLHPFCLPPSYPPPLATTNLFSISLRFFCFRFYIYVRLIIQYLSFSVGLTSLSVVPSKAHSCCCKWQHFILFYGWIIFHCVYIPHFLYPFIHLWTLSLFPCLRYCK